MIAEHQVEPIHVDVSLVNTQDELDLEGVKIGKKTSKMQNLCLKTESIL